MEAADITTSAPPHRDTSTWLRSITSAPSLSSSTTTSTMRQVNVSNRVPSLRHCVSQSLSFQNDFTRGICDLFSSALTGMVSRLKYIVSTRTRPPSTVGLGYGRSNSNVHKIIRELSKMYLTICPSLTIKSFQFYLEPQKISANVFLTHNWAVLFYFFLYGSLQVCGRSTLVTSPSSKTWAPASLGW